MEAVNNNQLTINEEAVIFIKEKREALGWTQARLAEEVFGSKEYRTFICKIEKGNRKITLETLWRILSVMNCSIEFKES